MPFKSQAQRGFMYSEHPKMAKEFEAATPKGAKLPYKVGGGSKGGFTAGAGTGVGRLQKMYGGGKGK